MNRHKSFFRMPSDPSLSIVKQDFRLGLGFPEARGLATIPADWKKINKNVFIGNSADLWSRSRDLGNSKCVCNEHSGCGESCLNKCVYYECDESSCSVGRERCQNRSFDVLSQRVKDDGDLVGDVELINTGNRGLGLRAVRAFQPNEIIVEYCGEIITPEECERRLNSVYRNSASFYFLLFHHSTIIDAGRRGSIARFANHSCDPNCKMEKWIVAGKPRMALFAGEKGIQPGEELTYDYNFNWFSGSSSLICRCSSENCRGWLGKRSDIRISPCKVEDEPDGIARPTLPSRVNALSSRSGARKRRGRPPGSKVIDGKLVVNQALMTEEQSKMDSIMSQTSSDQPLTFLPLLKSASRFQDGSSQTLRLNCIKVKKRRGRPPKRDTLRNDATGREDVWDMSEFC